MDEKRNFSKKIINLRKLKKIKQKDLAQELGISPSTLSDYENNRAVPTIKILLNLCDIFNVPIDYFYSSYIIKQQSFIFNDDEDVSDYFCPVFTFSLEATGIEPHFIRTETVNYNDIPFETDPFFYFEYNGKLLLFRSSENANYPDTVLAFAPDSETPDIFDTEKRNDKIYFVSDNNAYEKEVMKIVGILFAAKEC
ncbi:MAG: helix-turn-helix transcriptional regulator [Oscillospiraceae bacterium]|nr:helix-turn-helix transcriptional regulator [Oscillospiraceae bacterium]